MCCGSPASLFVWDLRLLASAWSCCFVASVIPLWYSSGRLDGLPRTWRDSIKHLCSDAREEELGSNRMQVISWLNMVVTTCAISVLLDLPLLRRWGKPDEIRVSRSWVQGYKEGPHCARLANALWKLNLRHGIHISRVSDIYGTYFPPRVEQYMSNISLDTWHFYAHSMAIDRTVFYPSHKESESQCRAPRDQQQSLGKQFVLTTSSRERQTTHRDQHIPSLSHAVLDVQVDQRRKLSKSGIIVG